MSGGCGAGSSIVTDREAYGRELTAQPCTRIRVHRRVGNDDRARLIGQKFRREVSGSARDEQHVIVDAQQSIESNCEARRLQQRAIGIRTPGADKMERRKPVAGDHLSEDVSPSIRSANPGAAGSTESPSTPAMTEKGRPGLPWHYWLTGARARAPPSMMLSFWPVPITVILCAASPAARRSFAR